MIHTLRNLDLNKLTELKGGGQQTPSHDVIPSGEISEELTNHHGNKKAIKNQHNMTSQAGRGSGMIPVGDGTDKKDPPRVMLGDMPKNSALNRTFDLDDKSDEENGDMDGHYDVGDDYVENGQDEPGNVEVQVVEHDRTAYNYGVPSASPATQQRSRTGLRLATSFASQTGKGSMVEERIRVCVRKRPLNQKEWKAGEEEAVTTDGSSTVLVKERKLTVDLTKIVQVVRI